MTHVVVVGAGIVGLASARALALRGADVTVLEAGLVASGTSSRGEGNMLVSDKELAGEATLALRSLALWRTFAEQSRVPFEYEPKGGVIAAHTDRQLELLRAQARRQAALGIDSTVLDTEALRRVEPNLSPALAGGLHYPQDAQVMPIQATQALATAATDLGADIQTDQRVVSLCRIGAGLRLLTSSGRTIDGDAVVNAAGPWAGEMATTLGGSAPVFPRRGLLLVTERRPARTVRHKVYDGRYVEAVASDDATSKVAPVIESTLAGTILIGSTREAVGWDRTIDWGLVGQLSRDAVALFPCLAQALVIRTYQGFRPATPDHLPLIGPDARVAGLFHHSGHEGAGVGLALGSAELLADAILDDEVSSDFDPRRFDRVPSSDDASADFTHLGTTGPSAPPGAACFGSAGSARPIRLGLADTDTTAVAATMPGTSDQAAPDPRPTAPTTSSPVFCGIGHCFACVTIDTGRRTHRTCQPTFHRSATAATDNADGPVHADCLVIGAGPAGMAAATRAADDGVAVVMLDRYGRAGGQIARQPERADPVGPGRPGNRHAAVGSYAGIIEALPPQVSVWNDTEVAVLRRLSDGQIQALVHRGGRLQTIVARTVILAAGGREVATPFPGWTLPGVMTAGAIQATLKRTGSLPWTQVALGGSGPLLLAVAAAMAESGRPPLFTLESRRLSELVLDGLPTGVRFPAKAAQFARLTGAQVIARSPDSGRRLRFGWRIIEALGTDRLEAIRIAALGDAGRTRTVQVDAIGISGGLVPDITLAVQLDCVLSPGDLAPVVRVDDHQQTSVRGVFAAGEMTGVGGAEKSLAEGRVAGAAVAARLGFGRPPAGRSRASASRWRRFAVDLDRLYPPDRKWPAQIDPATTVCRCEGVSLERITQAISAGATTARSVKGLTRCGMGYCQGAVCGPLVGSVLQSAGHDDVGHLESRPLATPVTVRELASLRH